ncbi:MAG: hypothetical protein NXH96_15330 [Alteromonadaceae bacterium]|nr:hypothetical protein [Alteromonadaceae bacterium]
MDFLAQPKSKAKIAIPDATEVVDVGNLKSVGKRLVEDSRPCSGSTNNKYRRRAGFISHGKAEILDHPDGWGGARQAQAIGQIFDSSNEIQIFFQRSNLSELIGFSHV